MRKSLKKRLIFCLICTFITLLSPQTIYALDGKFDKSFYEKNDILYYNPNATVCNQDGSDTVDVAAANVDNNDNLKSFITYFTGKGLSLAAASGMAGNIRQESNFNPRIIQGGGNAPENYQPVNGKGFGIVQWTYTSRQKPLVEYAKSQNKPVTDLGVQLGFMWKEMNESYKPMLQRLNAEKSDPVAAAIIFHGKTNEVLSNPIVRKVDPPYGYEASGDSGDSLVKNRGGAALAYYKQFNGKIQDGTGIAALASTDAGSGTDGVDLADPSQCGDNTTATDTNLGVGQGKFTDKGEVKNFATVLKNSQMTDQIFGSSMEGSGWCASIVSRSWRGQDIGYGVNYAVTLWDQNAHNGIGHADRSPKKGAILIYRSDHQAAGHVTTYLGDNKILNDGKIRDASYVEAGGWGEHYLGWIDPNDLGWNAKPATTDYLKNTLSRYKK